jgi:hypothetical protein
MKKLLLSAALVIGLITPVFGDTYTPQNPDCSKTGYYLEELIKQGFVPLFKQEDIIHNGVYHLFAYNTKTHETVFLTSIGNDTTDKTKICIDFIGQNVKLSNNLEAFRTFLDDSFKAQANREGE